MSKYNPSIIQDEKQAAALGLPGGRCGPVVHDEWAEITAQAGVGRPRRAGAARPGLSYAHICSGVVSFKLWDRGNRVDLGFDGHDLAQSGGGYRGEVVEFSRASRQRLIKMLNTWDRDQLQPAELLFVTLTYPDAWPADPRVWKRDLRVMRGRMEREHGKRAAVWKIEPQKRGAPHYHILWRLNPEGVVGGLEGLQRWVSRAWYEAVGSGDDKHLRAGTSVEQVRSWRGVASYTSKYIAKQQGQFVNVATGEQLRIGRWWGVWNADRWPISTTTSGRVDFLHAVRVRRVLRRLSRRQRELAARARAKRQADEMRKRQRKSGRAPGPVKVRRVRSITSHVMAPVCTVSFFVDPAIVRRLLGADLSPPGESRTGSVGGRGCPPRTTREAESREACIRAECLGRSASGVTVRVPRRPRRQSPPARP